MAVSMPDLDETAVRCACGCDRVLTPRQCRRGNRYASKSCSGHVQYAKPGFRAAAASALVRGNETNRRRHAEQVKRDILATCRDVLEGADPSRAMVIVAVRMRNRGYHAGYRARQSRDLRGAV